MENKILVELIVPELEEKFDVFIPITKRVGNVIALLAKAITELGIDYNLMRKSDILGKALYQVESQGYAFQTSEVYDSSVSNFETLSLRRQHQKIYSSDVVKVSVKYA